MNSALPASRPQEPYVFTVAQIFKLSVSVQIVAGHDDFAERGSVSRSNVRHSTPSNYSDAPRLAKLLRVTDSRSGNGSSRSMSRANQLGESGSNPRGEFALPLRSNRACQRPGPERGSVSRSTFRATDALALSKGWPAGKGPAGHRPALLWLRLRRAAPYCQFVIGRAPVRPTTLNFADLPQVTNLRYGRLQVRQVCPTDVGNTVNKRQEPGLTG
jgi:hypothetical protein